jgi:nitroreductase
MDVLEAIRTRRSHGRMLPDSPPRELIERVLAAAVCAPNHYLTEPWRFVVLTGEAREALGRAQEAALRRSLAEPDAPEHQAALAKERAKPLRSPVVVIAAVEKSTLPKAVWLEDVCATAAAVQNLLLAAHAEYLAAIWRTGETAYSPEVKEAVGLSPDAQVIGIVYLGYPDRAQPPADRAGRAVPVEWRGWAAETQTAAAPL